MKKVAVVVEDVIEKSENLSIWALSDALLSLYLLIEYSLWAIRGKDNVESQSSTLTEKKLGKVTIALFNVNFIPMVEQTLQ